MVSVAAQRQKITTLDPADSRAFDTLSGGLLRVLSRLGLHRARLGRLERGASLAPIARRGASAIGGAGQGWHRPRRRPAAVLGGRMIRETD
jgi:hypothetical protein